MLKLKDFRSILCFVFILSLPRLISNLEIERINDPYETKIAKKLIKYLDKKIDELPHVVQSEETDKKINNDDTSNDIQVFHDLKKHNRKKVLVKSIIPNDMVTNFGRHFGKNHFKPRYINTDNKYTIHRSDNRKDYFFNRSNETNPLALKLINWMNMKYNLINSYTQQYKDMAGYVKKLLNANEKKTMRDTIKKLLRFDVSDETNFGQKGYYLNANRVTTTPKRKWLPDYPFWSYWTYKKGIYQDECPGATIASGGMCVWVPPH